MNALTEQDMDALADRLISKVHEKKHAFWIDPEQHYQDHAKMQDFSKDEIRDMHDLLRAYRNARGLFWKAFFGFAIVGALMASAVGMGFSK